MKILLFTNLFGGAMNDRGPISLALAVGFLILAVGGGFGFQRAGVGERPVEKFFGQLAPGAEPVKFCPEILTAEKHPHGQLAFSPDGTGVFWSAMLQDGPEQTVFYSTFDGKTLSRPTVAPFAAAKGNGGPAFSADGKRLFFSAELPPAGGSSAARMMICYVDRTTSGWTKPVPIESTMDTQMTKGQVSVARSGNIYFSGRVLTERVPAIYVCRYSGGKYLAPEKLAGPLAMLPHVLDPWVDPDEKFLLVSCPPQAGPPFPLDIGISTRQPDGSWGLPVRLGRTVNTEASERFPSVTRDGKYLFFIRSFSPQFVGDQAHFYWTDASILDDLKRKAKDLKAGEIFTPKGRLVTEGRIFGVASHDFDKDGRPDIIVSDYLNPARILYNDAGLQFKKAVPVTSTAETAKTGHGVALRDFNGDGRLDIFLVYNEYPSPALKLGNGVERHPYKVRMPIKGAIQ